MKLFKERAKQANPKQDAIASEIAKTLLRLQRHLADQLNSVAARLPIGIVRLLLMLLCILFAAVNIYLLVQSS